MVDSNRELRLELRRALDEVYPPAPWLASAVRDELRKKRRLSWTDRLRAQPPQMRVAIVAGVALILIAAMAAAALLAAQLYAPVPVKKSPPPLTGEATVPIQTGRFFSAQDGYVVAERGLLITHDGGEHWLLALPLDWNVYPQIFSRDDKHIAVVTVEPGKRVLHATADGGVHWNSNPIAAVEVPGEEQVMSFIDDREGWQQVNSYAGNSKNPLTIAVYHTTDSGAHWSQVARVAKDHPTSHGLRFDLPPGPSLTFTDAKHGFMSVRSPDGVGRYYMTRDGGTSWVLVEFPAPPGGWTQTSKLGSNMPIPTMFGDQGVITIPGFKEIGAIAYTTTDGGMTWNTPGPLPGAYGFPPVGYADASHWWMSDRGTLYQTADAGQSWQRVSSQFPAGFSQVRGLNPVSPQVLFAAGGGLPAGVLEPACMKQMGPCYFLLRSTDGGATWSIVKMPVAPPKSI